MADFGEALIWHMDRDGTSVADLARAARVSPDVIKKLRTRPQASTKAEAAARIANYYGKTVQQFIALAEPADTDRVKALVDLLEPEEVRFLTAQIRTMLATRDQP